VKREDAEKRGRRGETIAAWWLRAHGWRVLDCRVKTRVGEVDLIARRGKILAFIEVKTRTKQADLAYAVDEYRLRRVAAAAQALLPRYAKPDDGVRIDVILIAPWSRPQHVEDVWRG
jgi:putative endonuclease